MCVGAEMAVFLGTSDIAELALASIPLWGCLLSVLLFVDVWPIYIRVYLTHMCCLGLGEKKYVSLFHADFCVCKEVGQLKKNINV